MNPDHLRALEDRLIAAFTDESISADEYVAMAHEMVRARSHHLRAAIERIGIEKDSDYTLVMEEVGRMEAEEKPIVGRVEKGDYDLWKQGRIVILTVRRSDAPLDARDVLVDVSAHGAYALLSAAEAFISEAERMGYGKTSEKALPGSFDLLVKAVREVKG